MENLFFYSSKIVWLFVSPDSIIFLWLGVSTLLLWRHEIHLARRSFTCLILALLFMGLFPVGDWALVPLETKYPHNPTLDRVDGIIVLAGGEDARLSDIWNQVVLSDSTERNLSFVTLARLYPSAKLVYAGGSGSLSYQDLKASDVAQQLFSEQLLSVPNVIFERDSRNTYESVLFSTNIVAPTPDETWVLVTSAFHMKRSVASFCKLDWSVKPYPVDFRTSGSYMFGMGWNLSSSLAKLSIAMKEYLGLFAYRITGRSC